MNSEQISWRDKVVVLLSQVLGPECVRIDEPLSKHTTFKVGGPAAIFCIIESAHKLEKALSILIEQGVPHFVLGKGSDVLVADSGYDGVILQIADAYANVETKPAEQGAQYFICDAGLSLKEASEMACTMGLSGLEFACGIPGTVGGGIHQNAGAYGGSLADILFEIEVIFPDGTRTELSRDVLHMGYRESRVAKEKLVVTQATFLLQTDHREIIRKRMDEFTRLREEKQPLDVPSAGSTFKRPVVKNGEESIYVGPLIQQAGLQGKRIGGAEVSRKHAGFVVNAEDATAQDVYDLIKLIQKTVLQQFDVMLEPEVHFLGKFNC